MFGLNSMYRGPSAKLSQEKLLQTQNECEENHVVLKRIIPKEYISLVSGDL